ncbi:hypothetical protein D8895_12735 [Streptococcus sp. BCA20]|uniref:Uncharacterized protein n=2 Tax=Streptococcus intermedius TaxID=1338 RepID=T1ZDY8_STRIT|nr:MULTISPECIES: hypothetical protein [Streptococcus]RSJ14966.1 hypothetical protein D8895_12735 [Streptococcus sp. BCA20]AGU76434.1 hypothetical protein SIR_1073 [Streptococcus intermedius B196]AGU78270.1 hypothetical protein SII_1095 [Streptococcus intermedius C270]EHG12930.1 hypothetical protein HMPREF9177_00743 [Streptococcus intermedius F0413]EKU17460.1 hypothetical protein D593_0643 [Streptococcus intermedius BA1]
MIEMLAASQAEARALQIEIKKNQERAAIRSVVLAQRMILSTESMALQAWLEQESTEMMAFSSKTLVSDLQDGLTGKAAESARDYLTNIPRPHLQSPIKGGE